MVNARYTTLDPQPPALVVLGLLAIIACIVRFQQTAMDRLCRVIQTLASQWPLPASIRSSVWCNGQLLTIPMAPACTAHLDNVTAAQAQYNSIAVSNLCQEIGTYVCTYVCISIASISYCCSSTQQQNNYSIAFKIGPCAI